MTEGQALDLELLTSDMLPAATGTCWATILEERWEAKALADVPVYARSLPSWYGSPAYSVMLWRTPVVDWETGRLRWMVGRRLVHAPSYVEWRAAEYGGEVVLAPERCSPLRLECPVLEPVQAEGGAA